MHDKVHGAIVHRIAREITDRLDAIDELRSTKAAGDVDGGGPCLISRAALLFTAAATAVPAVAVASIPALAEPDAELIALGERLRTSWDALRDALARGADDEFDVLHDEGLEIVLEIDATPATTIAGLQVKALAVAWCVGDERFAEEDAKREGACAYDRALASMLRDLRTIGDAA